MALTPTIHSNTPTRPDLPFATHFCIEIDGIITAQFQEIRWHEDDHSDARRVRGRKQRPPL